jgi:hypothetical protein
MMRLFLLVGCSALSVALVRPANAAIVKYTNRAAFEAALQPGFYSEPQMVNNYPSYSGNGFSYVGSASVGPYAVGADLSTQGGDPSVITFDFGPQIKAFGGYFYVTDEPGNFTVSNFQISLNSGASIYSELSTSDTSFYGFVSDAVFSNAQISVATLNYATAGSVIVGTPVPGPLPVVGAASAFAFTRRLRQRVARARHGG